MLISGATSSLTNPPGVTSRDLLPALSNASTNICPLKPFGTDITAVPSAII